MSSDTKVISTNLGIGAALAGLIFMQIGGVNERIDDLRDTMGANINDVERDVIRAEAAARSQTGGAASAVQKSVDALRGRREHPRR